MDDRRDDEDGGSHITAPTLLLSFHAPWYVRLTIGAEDVVVDVAVDVF